jgi:predicted amidohydrolase
MIITVSAVQIGPCSEDVTENVERGVSLVRQAARKGARLVVLPEMFNTTFFAVEPIEHFDHFFETIPGPTTDRLCAVARECGVAVVAGLAEKTVAGRYYNSAVVIDSKGEVVGTYRKTHLPLIIAPPERVTYERSFFSPGDLGLPVFKVDGMNIGVLICYDRHFPEAFRTLAEGGAEIIVVPTGARTWNASWRSGIWECLLRTRAYENGIFIVAANRAGEERGTSYLGDSMIVSHSGGTILSRSDPGSLDDVVTADCDLDEVTTFREAVPFRRDLRSEIYSANLK